MSEDTVALPKVVFAEPYKIARPKFVTTLVVHVCTHSNNRELPEETSSTLIPRRFKSPLRRELPISGSVTAGPSRPEREPEDAPILDVVSAPE